jgi:hypothetical protein
MSPVPYLGGSLRDAEIDRLVAVAESTRGGAKPKTQSNDERTEEP